MYQNLVLENSTSLDREIQKKIAGEIIELENEKLSGKVVTKLSLLKNYCAAEEYHQKYLEKR